MSVKARLKWHSTFAPDRWRTAEVLVRDLCSRWITECYTLAYAEHNIM